ncbi:Fimbria adhesin protein precursor [compost metagenome]
MQKKKLMLHFLVASLLGLGGLGSTQVMACAPINGWKDKEQTVSFGDVIIQRDTPAGTVIATKDVAINNLPEEKISDDYCPGSSISANFTNGWTPLNGIAATNVAGIGVRITYFHWTTPDWILSLNETKSVGGGANSVWLFKNASWKVELIKTGPPASGNLTAGTWARVSILPATESPWVVTSLSALGVNNITALACSLTNTTISVPLGDVQSSAFTGITTTAGDKTFNLGLSCDKDANINVALAGSQNADTADTSVLALTNAGQSGTAKGVGVQLLYGSVPLKLNNNILLKTSAGGQETLPFSARYYQTQTAIGAGLANSSATLNITYQ